MVDEVKAAELAAELKKLTNYGLDAHRIMRSPTLMEALGAANARSSQVGVAMVEKLKRKIDAIQGEHHLEGYAQAFTSEQVREAIRILLKLTTPKIKGAPLRRVKALQALGLINQQTPPESMFDHGMVQGMRRSEGQPEYGLLMILARQIYARPSWPIHLRSSVEAYYNSHGATERVTVTRTVVFPSDDDKLNTDEVVNISDPNIRCEPTALRGCRVRRLTQFADSMLGVELRMAQIELPAVKANVPHTYSFTIATIGQSTYRSRPIYLDVPIDSEQLSIKVFFDEGCPPAEPVQALHLPPIHHHVLELDVDGGYPFRLEHVTSDELTIIGWGWHDEVIRVTDEQVSE